MESSFGPRYLFTDESLENRRRQVLESLYNVKNFTRKAYMTTTLGYIITSIFGFSDDTSPLPTQEQKAAKLLCKENSSQNFVVPYVLYYPYVIKQNLCNCLSSPIKGIFMSDSFTHEVLVSYLVDYICKSHNFIPAYRLLKIAYYCSGTGSFWKEDIENFPSLNQNNLFILVDTFYNLISFLYSEIRFTSVLTLEDIVFGKDGYFKLDNFKDATVIINTNEGFCLVSSNRKNYVPLYLDESPYYYYKEGTIMPGSLSFYTLIVSIVSYEELAKLFFSDIRGEKIWSNLFEEQAEEAYQRLNSKFNMKFFEGLRLKCTV